MCAGILGQVPDADVAGAVAADNLALVGVDGDIIGRAAVAVAALDGAGARLPDLDGAVLGARHHPLALAVEGDAGDVARVALKRQQRARVGRLDVVELDGLVAGGGEVALVGRDAQAVDLRVGVLDRAGADAGERLPEPADRGAKGLVVARIVRIAGRLVPDCVVVTGCSALSWSADDAWRGKAPEATNLCRESPTWRRRPRLAGCPAACETPWLSMARKCDIPRVDAGCRAVEAMLCDAAFALVKLNTAKAGTSVLGVEPRATAVPGPWTARGHWARAYSAKEINRERKYRHYSGNNYLA